MKFSKLLLAMVGATILVGALVSSAFAGKLSASSQVQQILWTRMNIAGGIGGPVECEVLVSGSLHTRTITKTINSLIGYITEGTVLRCVRGSATIRQESFPWHRRYAGFTGTLPRITATSETATGAEYEIREPGGIICNVVNATNSFIYGLSAGVVSSVEVSGRSMCGSFFTASFSGVTGTVAARLGGVRITVTLI